MLNGSRTRSSSTDSTHNQTRLARHWDIKARLQFGVFEGPPDHSSGPLSRGGDGENCGCDEHSISTDLRWRAMRSPARARDWGWSVVVRGPHAGGSRLPARASRRHREPSGYLAQRRTDDLALIWQQRPRCGPSACWRVDHASFARPCSVLSAGLRLIRGASKCCDVRCDTYTVQLEK